MKKVLSIFVFILFLFQGYIIAQTTICSGDSIKLITTNAPTPTQNIQWQESVDTIVWTDILGATETTHMVYPTSDTYYRIKVIDTECIIDYYSDIDSIFINNVPAQPSIIYGDTNLCIGATEIYSVVNIIGVTYLWTVPTDWIIETGQSTNEITVTVGTTNGNITVIPSNNCGAGTMQSIAVSVPSLNTYSETDDDATIYFTIQDELYQDSSCNYYKVRIYVVGDQISFSNGDYITLQVLKSNSPNPYEILWDTDFIVTSQEVSNNTVDREFNCNFQITQQMINDGSVSVFAGAHVEKYNCGWACFDDSPQTTVIQAIITQ